MRTTAVPDQYTSDKREQISDDIRSLQAQVNAISDELSEMFKGDVIDVAKRNSLYKARKSAERKIDALLGMRWEIEKFHINRMKDELNGSDK